MGHGFSSAAMWHRLRRLSTAPDSSPFWAGPTPANRHCSTRWSGQKLAIVASRPQTTRTSIQGVVTLPEAQIVFIDTPGIHKSTTLLNRRMMDAVRAAADSPDLALFVIDSLAPYSEHDSHAIDLLKKTGAPAIAVLNKVDRLEEKPRLLKLIERYKELHDFAAFIPVSRRGRRAGCAAARNRGASS